MESKGSRDRSTRGIPQDDDRPQLGKEYERQGGSNLIDDAIWRAVRARGHRDKISVSNSARGSCKRQEPLVHVFIG